MNDIKKTEKLLAKFSRESSPNGLRAKVLETATRKRELNRLISPFLMKAALISGITAAAFLIIDAGLEGSQKKRLASLTEHRQSSPQKSNDYSSILREFVAGDSNASWAIWRLKIGSRAKEKEALETRKRLLRREIDEY